MQITDYKHCDYNVFKLMNKEKFPQTNINWTGYEEFNEIYKWALDNCIEGKKTKSGGIAGGPYNRYHNFYFTNVKKASIELIIAHTKLGCYKFVVKTEASKENSVSGIKALKEVFKTAEDFGVLDTFKANAVDSVKGEEIKKEIESPMIRVESQLYLNKEFEHCYHLDANSSYFSRISENWPELRELGEYFYKNRKNNDGYFKHVMTNSIGAMQSKYCLDVLDDKKYYNHKVPYQLSEFSKVAINGTNKFISSYIIKLMRNGFEPLLINTDGIWYRSKDRTNRCFTDENEGTELGQWKNDHKDVKLYIKSAGAYQFIEKGKVKTVLRGTCQLDRAKPNRDDWSWREIENQSIFEFKFVEYEGIIKSNE